MNTQRTHSMMFAVGLVFVSALCSASLTQGQTDQCAHLQRLIKQTYTFKPSLLSEAEKTAKSGAMDRVWDSVKAKPALLPCLRTALADPKADGFFRFDGSNLLLSLDNSPESKVTLIQAYNVVDLNDVDLRVWVGQLARLGSEGFDVSESADKWMRFPGASYYLPQHGGYKVTVDNGAMFLFGSMDEAQATPALIKVLSDKNHPGREIALWALMNQATTESLKFLKGVNPQEFSVKAQSSLSALLTRPALVVPRAQPKNSRQEFVSAFQSLLKGDSGEFLTLVSQVPDGERDVVAVLKPEDLPLVRRVRRRIITAGNQHSIEFYNSFTLILQTLISQPTPAE